MNKNSNLTEDTRSNNKEILTDLFRQQSKNDYQPPALVHDNMLQFSKFSLSTSNLFK